MAAQWGFVNIPLLAVVSWCGESMQVFVAYAPYLGWRSRGLLAW